MKKDTKDREKKKIKKVNRETDYLSDIKMNACEMATKTSNWISNVYGPGKIGRERYTQQMKRSDQSQRHQTEAEKRVLETS